MGWASRVSHDFAAGVLAKGGVLGVFIKAGRITLQ
jgi:hypothetical protein